MPNLELQNRLNLDADNMHTGSNGSKLVYNATTFGECVRKMKCSSENLPATLD